MKVTVKEIAELIGGEIKGNADISVSGVAGLLDSQSHHLSFLRSGNKKGELKKAAESKAGVIIVPIGVDLNGKTIILVENPMAAFSKVLEIIQKEINPVREGIDSLSSIHKNTTIGKNVYIGPFCVIEEGAHIGDGAQLISNIFVGKKSSVGKKSLIYPHVSIREECSIGNACILHSGCVIGSDGYGFYFENGRHNKIPQIGNVIVEDEVEIGAGSTIDRATTGSTIIRKGAKIDNLVQVAHNVEVGEYALLVAQVGIAGSSKIGKGVVLAGQVGVADHVNIGDGAQIGAQSGLKDDVPPGAVLFGSPAQPIQDTIKQSLLIRKLPQLFKDIKKLKENRK